MTKYLFKNEVISIPNGCEVTMKDKVFTFKGPLGEQSYDASRFNFTFILENNQIEIQSWHGNQKKNDLLYTVASHLKNNAKGVITGYRFVVNAIYLKFTIQMVVEKDKKEIIVKNYYGNKQPKIFPIIGNTTATIGEDKDILIIEGINLEDVSQTAANIENWTRKMKMYDPRVFLDGIFIIERGEKVC